MTKPASKLMAWWTNQDRIPRATTDGRSHVPGVPHELAIEIDKNGSPVTAAEEDWYVCFVPGLQRQWWHRFANAHHKHVFALRPQDENTWILFEPWWGRLMVNVLSLDEAVKFLRWGAVGDVLKVREAIPGDGSQARGWSNCAVLIPFLLGRSYWTWTPHGLFRRLLKDPQSTRVDVSRFLSDHLKSLATKNAESALHAYSYRADEPLQDALVGLGIGIMTASVSPSAVGLYKVAVSEASRFQGAADEYWTSGPKRAIALVQQVLENAQQRGEIRVSDCALAARRFISMLRGNLQLEILYGIRGTPSQLEVHAFVRSAVGVLLNGACRQPPVASRASASDAGTR